VAAGGGGANTGRPSACACWPYMAAQLAPMRRRSAGGTAARSGPLRAVSETGGSRRGAAGLCAAPAVRTGEEEGAVRRERGRPPRRQLRGDRRPHRGDQVAPATPIRGGRADVQRPGERLDVQRLRGPAPVVMIILPRYYMEVVWRALLYKIRRPADRAKLPRQRLAVQRLRRERRERRVCREGGE
jgi:hypothetical protein